MGKKIICKKDAGKKTINLLQKKNVLGSIVIAVTLIMAIAFSGCTDTNASSNTTDECESTACLVLPSEQTQTPEADKAEDVETIEKIEVYHFHGTHQCYSCIAVGDYAEETINSFFADELKSAKIVFGHINGELPENQELVKKYEATGSSLWIGVYTSDGKFIKEQNIIVWYKISKKQDYLNYLKDVIEKKLSGDLS